MSSVPSDSWARARVYKAISVLVISICVGVRGTAAARAYMHLHYCKWHNVWSHMQLLSPERTVAHLDNIGRWNFENLAGDELLRALSQSHHFPRDVRCVKCVS